MSGICGLFNLKNAPVLRSEIYQMTGLLNRRGPDRSGSWTDRSVGLGHTLLTTTSEAIHEHLPLVDRKTGCVIAADARLDNRTELLERLGLSANAPSVGDAELIIAAYRDWDTSCVDHFLRRLCLCNLGPAQTPAILRSRSFWYQAVLISP